MDIKTHPDYWKIHKLIWQQECDNLPAREREIVMGEPHNSTTTRFNKMVAGEIERKLLLTIE
jgi:hypothetical protein